MGDPLFDRVLGIGAGGIKQVIIDPERVTQEEYEAAAVFVNTLWGTDGLVQNLGPSWFLVHDPRFLRIERSWIIDKDGILGGKQAGGLTVLKALDLKSDISMAEDPALYAEIFGEGRHFRNCCIQRGFDPKALCHDSATIELLMRSECPNYRRRTGEWNNDAEKLRRLLYMDIVGLVDDYATVAYSQDWIRMDTGEVVGRNETVVDPESQENVPTCAVEIDSFHKALIMRAMVRTTALRVMLQFPGIKKSEFAAIRLTDNESDKLCQMLFKVDYDKMYTVMPAVMTLIKHAQNTPVDYREREELRMMRAEAAKFLEGMTSGEITPIITPIEEAPMGTVDPTRFLQQLSGSDYFRQIFQIAQDQAQRGDEVFEKLIQGLVDTGGSVVSWEALEDRMMAVGLHPFIQAADASISQPNTLGL